MSIATAYARLMGKSVPHQACGGVTAELAQTRGGYIQLTAGSAGRIYAHRLVWEAHNGPVPDGKYALHRCDQPRCFEIRHLFLGTLEENNADRDAKGRGVVPDTRGMRHGMRKLTEAEVREIYRSTLPGKLLAQTYEVNASCISKIRTGKAWKHLTMGESS